MQYNFDAVIKVLKSGGTILYPTDTIWGVGCDATNARAVERIYKIKLRDPGKSLVILVDTVEMLGRYVEQIPDVALELIERIRDPLTIIYPAARNLAKNSLASDGSIAIRIPVSDFCRELIQRFGKPIVSTSANISGDPSPLTFGKISEKIISIVDYVVELSDQVAASPKPSTIIKITPGGDMQIIRS